MKKADGARKAKAKPRARPKGPLPGTPRNIDDYLSRLPEDACAVLQSMRKTIKSVAPEAIEVISYQLPAFRYHGLLVAIGARPSHCALFPLNPSVMDQFTTELEGFDTSKGTIRFPVDRPMPAGLLKRIVKARIAQNFEREAGGGK